MRKHHSGTFGESAGRSLSSGRILALAGLWLALGLLAASQPTRAQEVEVRRWNHLPVDTNFFIANYAHTSAQISIDSVLQIEDVTLEMDTWMMAYIRTLELFDRTVRVEARQAYKSGEWSGLLAGVPASTRREGFDDTVLRVSVSLLGGPPLAGPAFAEYRAQQQEETIVGLALGIQLPTGHYKEAKLINLGSNRFTFRPQLGLQHKQGRWVFEATVGAAFTTANDEFAGDQRLEQDPFYSLDGSIEYRFPSGLWASAGVGATIGGETSVDGLSRDDRRDALGWVVSVGMPISSGLSIRASYLGSENLSPTGMASHSIGIALQASW